MSKLQNIRNQIEMVKRQVEEADRHCAEIKNNYDILCIEADQKTRSIDEVKFLLLQSNTELTDCEAFLSEANQQLGKGKGEDDTMQRFLHGLQPTHRNIQDAMVNRLMTMVESKGLGGGGGGAGSRSTAHAAGTANGDAKGKRDEAKASSQLDSVVVTFHPLGEQEPHVANFKVIRNYTFEQLLEDACRHWDLFPPDMKIVNQHGGKWALERTVQQEWELMDGGDMVVKVLYTQDDDEEEMEAEEEDDDAEDDEVFGVDQRKQWPPPLNRRTMLRELIVYLLFVVDYILFIGTQRVTEDHFHCTLAMRTLLVEEEFGDFNILTFNDIRTGEELTMYVLDVLAPSLFEDEFINGEPKPLDQRGNILNYNRVIGGVQFKQHRVTKTDCPTGERERQHNVSDWEITRPLVEDCFDWYTAKSQAREAFGTDTTQEGFYFVEVPKGESDEGFYASYPASGFIKDVPFTPLTDGDEFQASVQELFDNGWLDEQTRCVVVQLVVYNPNYNVNVQIKFVVEQTPAGEFRPFRAFINTFRIFKLEFQFSWEIVTFFLIVAFLALFLRQEVKQARTCNRVTGSYRLYFMDLWNVIEVFIIVSTCCVVGLFAWLFTHHTASSWTYFRDTYPELSNYVYIQQRLFDLFAVNIFLLVFKMFKYFPLVDQLHMLLKMLALAAKSLVNFLVMLAVLFVGFVVMANMIFGDNVENFTRLYNGFVYLYLYLLGDFDFESLTTTDRAWGPIFFTIYMVLFVMIMLNVFLAILNDAYVIVYDEEEEKKLTRKPKGKRTFADYKAMARRALPKLHLRFHRGDKEKQE